MTSRHPLPIRVSPRSCLWLPIILALATTVRADHPEPTEPAAPSVLGGGGALQVRGHRFYEVHLLSSELQAIAKHDAFRGEVAAITDGNQIDEIYFQDLETGKYYVSYGKSGAVSGIKYAAEGRRGTYTFTDRESGREVKRKVKLIKVDNEPNTVIEAAWNVPINFLKRTGGALTSEFDKALGTLITAGATATITAMMLKNKQNMALAEAAKKAPATVESLRKTLSIREALKGWRSWLRPGIRIGVGIAGLALVAAAVNVARVMTTRPDLISLSEVIADDPAEVEKEPPLPKAYIDGRTSHLPRLPWVGNRTEEEPPVAAPELDGTGQNLPEEDLFDEDLFDEDLSDEDLANRSEEGEISAAAPSR